MQYLFKHLNLLVLIIKSATVFLFIISKAFGMGFNDQLALSKQQYHRLISWRTVFELSRRIKYPDTNCSQSFVVWNRALFNWSI
jgi:hypothetical protein